MGGKATRATIGIVTVGMASLSMPSWNQIVLWLREMAALKEMGHWRGRRGVGESRFPSRRWQSRSPTGLEHRLYAECGSALKLPDGIGTDVSLGGG